MEKFIIISLLCVLILSLYQNNNTQENFDPYSVSNPLFKPSPNCYESASGVYKCIQYPEHNSFLIYPKTETYNYSGEPVLLPQLYLE